MHFRLGLFIARDSELSTPSKSEPEDAARLMQILTDITPPRAHCPNAPRDTAA